MLGIRSAARPRIPPPRSGNESVAKEPIGSPDQRGACKLHGEMVESTMNKALKTAVIGLLFSSSVYSQEFIAPQPERREIVPVEPSQRGASIEGIVKEVFTKKPWQLVNPAAPARYGNGQKMISKDFSTGTPFHSTGWVVASVEW
jgi:hypothetical protein